MIRPLNVLLNFDLTLFIQSGGGGGAATFGGEGELPLPPPLDETLTIYRQSKGLYIFVFQW